MAEQVQRYRQYEYRANSNLVLTSDTARPRNDEPSGEPESLKDNLGSSRFGDRVHHSKPDLEGVGKKRRSEKGAPSVKRTKKESETVLGLNDDIDSYRPRSKETRSAYEDLLSVISQQLGDQPHDILRGAADEVLACLKNDSLTDPERKGEVEKLINHLGSEAFASLVQVGKRITDYMQYDGAGNERLDEELGVAVVFDDNDDDDDEGGKGRDEGDAMVDVDLSDEDADGDVGIDAAAPQRLAREDNEEGADGDGDELPINSIDAYWLQRECGKYFGDPLEAQKTAEDVLATLIMADERECENRLVILLDYDKFEFIRKLLKYRYRIACCTRLAQAQSDEERARLLAEFEADEASAAVVRQIAAAREQTDEIFTETKQLEARVRKETAELQRMQATAAGVGAASADLLAAVPEPAKARVGSQIIDLDALAFEQGGHLMANKKCALPAGSFRTQKKGYEEVHIPALKPKPFLDDEALVPIDTLPEWARPAFAGMRTLNRIQSRVHRCAPPPSDLRRLPQLRAPLLRRPSHSPSHTPLRRPLSAAPAAAPRR